MTEKGVGSLCLVIGLLSFALGIAVAGVVFGFATLFAYFV